MCGLFGLFEYSRGETPAAERLRRTAAILRARGPDGWGVHADRGIALVHTRLALVDLDRRSDQPFWDRTRRFALVYNGELYDYGELRGELARRGTDFCTTGDTEVLLEALIQLGVPQTLSRIDGMFTFALYDSQTHRLWLARDRMGIKPCFVARQPERLLFASSVSALAPWIPLQPDRFAVAAYLHGAPGATLGRTFFEGIETLPPGTYLELTGSPRNVTRRTYFQLADLSPSDPGGDPARCTARQHVDRLDEALTRSVQAHTAADAPMGALCSGGVDSSLVLAIATRCRSGLVAFHADLVGPLSERPAAERLARHLRTELVSITVHDDDFVTWMPEIAAHYGFPFTMHANAVPFFRVAQQVRSHGIKAVLCGEGADELFLGYPWLVPNVRAILRALPRGITHAIAEKAGSWERRLRGKDPTPRLSGDDQILATGLLTGFEREFGPPTGQESNLQPPNARSQRRLAESGVLSFILRSLLHRNDSMGMAHGIETRFPLLNRHVMETAVRMPTRHKIRFSPSTWDWHHLWVRDKWALRQVARRYLPRELSERKKIPFPTNAYRRLQIDPRYFDDSYLGQLFEMSRARVGYLLDRASIPLRLRLLQLDVWGRIYFWSETPAALSEHLRARAAIGRLPSAPAARPPVRKAA